jgi:diguanylate cyclase (GGDEF)-like protein/PAS domain S-box-containing protein
MNRFEHLKPLTNTLESSKEEIIERWLASSNISSVFAGYDIGIDYFRRNFADGVFEAILGLIKWGSSITSAEGFERLMLFVNQKMIRYHELVLMQDSLRASFVSALYDSGSLSKNSMDDIDAVFAVVFREVSEHLLAKVVDFSEMYEREKLKNIRLLNEYKKAVDESNIVSKTTPKGIITYVNRQFCKISGYDEDELLGQPHNIIRHPDMPKEAFREMWKTIKAKQTWKGVVKNLKKDGSSYIVDTTIVPIIDVDGDIVEFIGIRHDITELETAKEQLKLLNFSMKKKVSELYDMTQSLEQQASTDVLTGIFNRYKFDEVFEVEIKKAKINNNDLCLILFDIDHFKDINDTFGHGAGDVALSEVARIVAQNVKRGDIFARWGGEEFAVLAVATSLEGGVSLSEKLREEIASNHFGFVNKITASFGVSSYRQGDSVEEMLKRADDALYAAKKNGRDRVEAQN